MAKSQETFNKKEKEKKRLQKRKEKDQKKADRKANPENKSFEDMIAYVDEDGNISDTPPDATKKRKINEADIVIGSRNIEGAANVNARKGKVLFFNTSKGYGFIKDESSQESIFVHINSITIALKENDKVSFETQKGPKGLTAVNVKKI